MKKCNICGKKISDFSEICPYCSNTPTVVNSIKGDGVLHGKKPRNILIICLVVTFIIIVMAVGLFIISQSAGNSKQCAVDECTNQNNSYSRFCNEHVCNHIGCDSKKSTGYQYCVIHMCKYEGCQQSNSLELDILTCDEHTCHILGCTNMVFLNSNYCVSHTCSAQNCCNPTQESTQYCSSHIINDVTCSFEITTSGELYLEFSYTNCSGKYIKSSHIDVVAYDFTGNELATFPVDISCSGSLGERIALGLDMGITGMTIGYSPQCSRIEIINFTVYYSDGSIEDGFEKLIINN